MSVPPAAKLREVTRAIVQEAHDEGTLSKVTIRIVRGLVEDRLKLETGALDAKELRQIVKKATLDAKAELPSSSPKENSSSLNPRQDASASDNSADEKPAKASSSSKKRQRAKESSKAFKSAETIPTSDEEEETKETKTTSKKFESPSRKVGAFSGSQNMREAKPFRLQKQQAIPKQKKKRVESERGSDLEDEKPKSSPPPTTNTLDEEMSDDGLSSDAAPPKPKKAKKETKKVAKEKTGTKGKKGAKDKEPLSKDEATIKRLKSFVLACGVRKVWGVYFKDSPEPSQQIRKLRELLHELGMKERFTLEQAKKIKEKRELAQELEDVQTFEKSFTSRGKRASRSSKSHLDSDEEMEDIEDLKARRKTALQSINAFLDSQSEDET